MIILASEKGWECTLSCEKDGRKMPEEGAKVTLRMGNEEIQMMEDFMAEHDIGNRSDFIRDAIRGYISYEKSGIPVAGNGLFVHFSELHLDALRGIVERGIALDEEEFVRKCVLDKIVSDTVREEVFAEAFQTARRNAALR